MAADDLAFARARWISRISLGACLVFGVLAMAEAMAAWPHLPDRLPIHFGLQGTPDGWARRSIAAVFVLPLMALILGPAIAALGMLSVGPKHLPSPDRVQLRGALPPLAIFLAGIALLMSGLMFGISHGALRVGQGHAAGLGRWPIIGALVIVLWSVGGAFYFLIKHSPPGKPDGPEADPARWKWGMFYVAPDDPSLFVEKRWGGGYTVNFGIPAGRRLAWWMLGWFLLVGALAAWLIVTA